MLNSPKTILIVDDEPIAQDIMAGFLASEGYQLVMANNGQEALDYLSQQLPDVILLDVMMPYMDGFTVCQRLKSNRQWRHVPIIMVTALGSKEDLLRGLTAGADDFLHKPVNELELRARIRSMLRIKQQYDELKANLDLREDLAHMVMHDMRTPLNIILGFSELAQESDITDTQKTEFIKEIESQAHRLNSFITDLLILTKIEAGQLILNRVTVDIHALVRQTIKSHAVIARSRQIELVSDMPPEPRQLLVDLNLFQRVLDNLMSNALKFSLGEGKVVLTVNYLAPSHLSATAHSIQIKVSDEGPGVSAEYRERIFDRFEIATLQRSTGMTQIGLGLAFCKMVVDAHGGRIFVEDNTPKGSV